MGEGLRKLPHPQLWFLVGPLWQRGREVFVILPTKAVKQKKPRAPWEQAAKAPKIKHRAHLSSDRHLRLLRAWPGGWEEGSSTHSHTRLASRA